MPTLRTPEVMGKQNPNDFIWVFPGSQKNKAIVSTLTVPKSSHSKVTCCSLSWFCTCSASLPPHVSPLETQPVAVCIPPHEGFVPSDTADGIQSMHFRIKEKDGFSQRPHIEKVWNVTIIFWWKSDGRSSLLHSSQSTNPLRGFVSWEESHLCTNFHKEWLSGWPECRLLSHLTR